MRREVFYFSAMNEQHNPWTLLNAKEVYANPWISVEHHEVLNPSGKPGIYGKVHFRNVAIGIIPVDAEGNTWLVGQWRYPLNQYSWEIPEGGGPLEVDILDSAKRELEEECGLHAEKWTELQRLHLSNSVSDESGILFLAQDLKEGIAAPEETEQLLVRKVPLSVAFQMVEDGVITDSLSVAGLQKLQLLQLQGKL